MIPIKIHRVSSPIISQRIFLTSIMDADEICLIGINLSSLSPHVRVVLEMPS